MVRFCICECCENYINCCNYKCQNHFNYHHFDECKWTLKIFNSLCEYINECDFCNSINSLILCPFALTFDIISCPCRCCFECYGKCECEKIKITPSQNVSIIIEQPPLYNEHYKHTPIIISLPPTYTE